MTTKQLKSLIAAALYSKYGFSPAAYDIHIMDRTPDGTYMLFEISGHLYKFNSFYAADLESIWTGSDTISKF